VRLRTILVSAAAVAAPLAVGFATAAQADISAGAVTYDAATAITGRAVTGDAGNAWATESILREAVLTGGTTSEPPGDCGPAATTCYVWLGRFTDTGSAQAISGQISPGVQAVPIKGDPTASLEGWTQVYFYASSAGPDPSLVPAKVTGNAVSDAAWFEQFFPAGTTFGVFNSGIDNSYAYVYEDVADCQTWDHNDSAKGDTGDITGVNACPPVPPVPVLSDGHATVSNTRATVTWKSTVTSTFEVTINGPGPLNGRMNKVTKPAAVYGGLESGHTYTVTIQPLVNGTDEGKTGRVTFKTTRT
jgi:hypothetical protein